MASKPPTFVRQVLVRSTSLEIKQCYIGDVGCVVWDAALVLTKFLENKFYFSNEYWKDKYVLELGAGTGIVGLATASLGANAVLTDLPELVELMETNIRANSDCFSHLPKAMPLVWGQDISEFLPHPDVILMADLIYYEESVNKLCKTVLELCGPHTVVLMCYEERDIGNKVGLQKDFNESLEATLDICEVPFEKLDEEMRSSDIKVFIGKNKDKFKHGCDVQCSSNAVN